MNKIKKLEELCNNRMLTRAIKFGEQGISACKSCPLYNNGMCDKIFNNEKVSFETVEKAIKFMENNND